MTLSPSPAAPVIKKLALEYLNKFGQFEIPALKEYVEDQGYKFTQGQYAGAIRSLLDHPGVTNTSRGVYKLDTDNTESVSPPIDSEEVGSLSDQINRVLDVTIKSLHQLGNANLLEVDENYFNEIQELKKIINAIEDLKFDK